jgi:hypothetical protein
VVAESKSAAPCSGISLCCLYRWPTRYSTRSVRCQMPRPECTSLNEDCVDRHGNTLLRCGITEQYIQYLFHSVLCGIP